MPSEAVAVTSLVTQTLDALQIPYVIGGSMASSAYGRVRTTMDVDIVADLQSNHVEPLVKHLGKEFYADAQMMRDAIAHQSSFNLIHLVTMFKVDVFVARDRSFAQQQLARRQSQILESPDHAAYIASPEDLILAKLEWYRLGGEASERHAQRHVAGV